MMTPNEAQIKKQEQSDHENKHYAEWLVEHRNDLIYDFEAELPRSDLSDVLVVDYLDFFKDEFDEYCRNQYKYDVEWEK